MVEVKCSNGSFYISECDLEKVMKYKWYISKTNGYVRRTTNDKTYLHRFLMEAKDGEKVDHKDRNKLNNTRENLRKCTSSENCCNRTKKNPIWKSKQGWQFSIYKDGKSYYFGSYLNKEDAMLMYNRKIKELHGEFAFSPFEVKDDGREIKTILETKKTSKYAGIYLRSDGKKWVVQLKGKYYGSYSTEEEALEVRDKIKRVVNNETI